MAETLTVNRDFFKDLAAMGQSENKIMSLDVPTRKEIFLKWKWFGSSSFNELEGSRRATVAHMKREDILQLADQAEKKYWLNVLNFEDYCTSVLKRIGVLPSDAGADSMIRVIAEKVGGTVKGGYSRKDWND